MKPTLKLDKSQKKKNGEHPLFVRIRGKNSKNKYSESSIYTNVDLNPKYFKGGGISPKTPNYTSKNRMVDTILDDIINITSEINEEGLEPNPQYLKKLYEDRIVLKEMKTPQSIPFWKGFDEYLETKKNKSYGYIKTIKTLKNQLKEFEERKKIRLTYEYIISRTPTFQSEFNDFCWNVKKQSNSYVNKFYDNLSGFLYFSTQMRYIPTKPKLKLEQPYPKDELVYLRTNEVIKLFNSKQWDYDESRIDELLNNSHITIIEEELKGTNKDKFGGVLKVTNWELVKYIFLFMNNIGCRIGDIQHFKVNHMDFNRDTQLLSWVQSKTSQRVKVPLNDISGFIFRKFSSGKSKSQTLFPKISHQKFNKQLKYLLRELGGFDREVSNPKFRGTETVNKEEHPLWKLISSHSGRRGFVKNSIDLGTMDYQTIMRLGGWRTFSEFQKYISFNHRDIMKLRGLNPLKSSDKKDMESKLVDGFSKLPQKEKETILSLTLSLGSK